MDYDLLEEENKRLLKENIALRNENATLRRTIYSQEGRIKDLSKGKEALLKLVVELNETINKKKNTTYQV